MSEFSNTLLIANPVAQSGKGAAAAQAAAKALNAGFAADECLEVFMTQSPGHAKEFVAEQGSRYSAIIALGGDGIIHEVANGMMLGEGCCRRLGVIPVGSGNDYAKSLKMSENVTEAVGQLLRRKLVAADLGCCNGEYFTETLSFGLDAAIALGTVERRKKTGKKGTMLYLEEGIDQLVHHLDMYKFNLEILQGPPEDVGSYSGDGLLIAVQNGVTYGGGFAVTPKARFDDGMLDICIARGPVNPIHATAVFLSAKNGHHVNSKIVEFRRASKLRLSFDKRPPCQIDGEPHIADSYEIDIAHNALTVFVG